MGKEKRSVLKRRDWTQLEKLAAFKLYENLERKKKGDKKIKKKA